MSALERTSRLVFVHPHRNAGFKAAERTFRCPFVVISCEGHHLLFSMLASSTPKSCHPPSDNGSHCFLLSDTPPFPIQPFSPTPPPPLQRLFPTCPTRKGQPNQAPPPLAHGPPIEQIYCCHLTNLPVVVEGTVSALARLVALLLVSAFGHTKCT